MSKTGYVVGFLFDETQPNWVVLIQKKRPAWQAGKLNGVGGHIEDGEYPVEAMVREFKEETGLLVTDWKEFAVVFDKENFDLHCFLAHGKVWECKTTTDEEIIRVNTEWDSYEEGSIDNIPWLIGMAKSFVNRDPGCTHYRVEYVRP